MVTDHTYILWIATFGFAIHITEELMFDWKGWATAVLKLPVQWKHFAVVNGMVIVLGISCACVGWDLPAYALSLPALMLINATFFHVGPFIVTKGRYSPGVGTSVLLFYPIGIWAYYGAWVDGVLTGPRVLISLLFGAALMASPIVMLKLQLHPYFKQDKDA